MPIITVNLLAGRDKARKTALIRELSETTARVLDAPLDSVRVILNEMAPDYFGIGGETAEERAKRAGEEPQT